MISNRVRSIVLIMITLAWLFNLMAPAFLKDYKPVPEINSIFMGIVGVLLTTMPEVVRRRQERNQPDEESEPATQDDANS